jgi:hypothetical protein
MADPRIPVFELHIAPMFRWIDREHMGRRNPPLDLSDYASVRARASEILDWLKDDTNSMPVASAGGPWPPEWIALFERWTQRFHRLVLATATNPGLTKQGNNYVLSCDAQLPDRGARGWLEKRDDPGKLAYQVMLETTLDAPPQPTAKTVREVIRGPVSAASIFLYDSAGEHELALPTV